MNAQPRKSPKTPAAVLRRELDIVAEKVVLADPHSHVALIALAERLNALAAAAEADNHTDIARAARAMSALCAETGADQDAEPAHALEMLEQTVIAFQEVIEKGAALADTALPEALREAAVLKQTVIAPDDTPIIDDPALMAGFVTEGGEHLDAAEAGLLTIEKNPSDQEAVNAVFRAFHTIKGVAAFLGLGAIRELAHEAETLLDRARKGVSPLKTEDIPVCIETIDSLRAMIAAIGSALEKGEAVTGAPLPGTLLERLRAASGTAAAAVETDRTADVQPQTTEPQKATIPVSAPQKNERVTIKEIVRIDAERLDRLLDTIGEIVIAESTVSQSPELRARISPDLERQLSQLDKITRELQEISTSLRMMPVRATFRKMDRLVRDLSRRVGKKVEIITSGEDTELDKSMVDMLSDPLVHMIRNTVDHGIESAEERVAAGKPETGRLYLRAFHRGGSIFIEIEDDGRGLDRQAILAKGRELELIAQEETPSDSVIYGLIFRPGFSTAAQVTDISGRGVGMDVVKRNIDAIRGQVDVRTEPGKGTCFSLRLPLTLAIIDGLVMQVRAERYIVPSLNVVRAVRPEPGDIQTVLGRGEMLRYLGEMYPLFRLERLLESVPAPAGEGNHVAILAEDDGVTVALLADDLIGKQQFVIKSLADTAGHTPGVAGCSIMPDGSVGLILSVSGLVRLAVDGYGTRSVENV